jgi:tetratricopeptide (TPR) repeat protein
VSTWPRWSLEGEPAALAKYVRPEEIAALVRLPGPPADSRLAQARTVYEALATVGITYSHEAPSDDPGRQVVREPGEVLWCPRHGTCLDLALVMAGACLHAGLHPFVVILDPPGAERAAHALLGVRIGDLRPGGPRMPDADVWTAPPEDWPTLVQHDVEGGRPRPLLLLDPVGVARALPTSPAVGTDVTFAEAAAAGARYASEWTWRLAVDIGRAWRRQDVHRTAERPRDEPLRSPYVRLDTAVHRPLEILKAEHEVVPFQARDELTVLTHFCRTVATGPHTGVALVHGVGGAGKTRLALELAEQLAVRHGWYTGYLREGTDGEDWLGVVTSPTLIVLDYVEARAEDARNLLRVLKRRAERGAAPAVVVMTARSAGGQWLTSLQRAWARDGHPVRECPPLHLPPEHPDGSMLFRRAVATFHEGGRAVDLSEAESAAPAEWTTLDHILLAFLATRGAGRLPTTREALYEEVLQHERGYWAQTYQKVSGSAGDAPLAVLDRAVTCLALRTPVTRAETIAALDAVQELAASAQWRETVHATLTTCLQPAPGEALVLRPDPIADHLTLRELDSDPDLLHRALDGLAPEPLLHALRQLNRAAGTDPGRAADMIAAWIDEGTDRWRPVLRVAVEQRGAALAALDRLVDATPAPPWLDELSEGVPATPLGLPQLAVRAFGRRLARLRAGPDPASAEVAELLRHLGLCQVRAGARPEAIESLKEAVGILRVLARTDPEAHRGGLAMALSTLSGSQSEAGEHGDALANAGEAVDVLRPLASTYPAAHQADLAAALVNLARSQYDTGDHPAALCSIGEAVDILRPLAPTDPAEHLPYLAAALNNLSSCQARLGNRKASLESITEAAQVYREVVRTNPAQLPNFAGALTNLSSQQRHAGDHAAALASGNEAVDSLRRLVFANPAAHLPTLAAALINLSASQGETGEHAAALASGREAVGILRPLTRTSPAAHLPALVTALNNLSDYQHRSGDHPVALATVSEAVDLLRPLIRAGLVTHLPALATALVGLSRCQTSAGDRTAARTSITEAVDIRRRLAQASPATYLYGLCDALNHLGIQQGDAGEHEEALATLAEAVDIGRTLVSADSDVHLPQLAASLNNLSNQQRAMGDREGALASSAEGVRIRRALARTNPSVYLPDLAISLATLSSSQGDAGDAQAALASITEAVDYFRRLARLSPAQHLHELAAALNNLSGCQSTTGDGSGALASISEAVSYLRRLAEARPAVYRVRLASALSNLSARQSWAGWDTAALASSSEAVDILRSLAHSEPDAHLRLLTTALNNLSNRQSDSGDDEGALASIKEVVEIRRALARTNPAAFRPALATGLQNLADRLARTGDGEGALAAIEECVKIRRPLARSTPAVFLPPLAVALSNLARCQDGSGRSQDALVSITEAVELLRPLARANPAVHLGDFVTALNRLTAVHHDSNAALTVWADAVAALAAHPLPQAELRAYYAGHLAGHGAADDALEQLVRAARAEEDGDPDVLRRVRRQIRDTAAEHGLDSPRLPDWATTALPDAALDLLNDWAGSSDWPDVEAFLSTHGEQLVSPAFRHLLQVAAAVFPGRPEIGSLTALVDQAASGGLDHVLESGRRTHASRLLVRAWLDTPDWQKSKDFLEEHAAALRAREVDVILSHTDHPVAHQHLAILELAERLTTDEVYAVVTDPAAAVDRAFQAVDRADLQSMGRIQAAHDEPVTGAPAALLAVVSHLTDGNEDEARRFAALLAENAGPTKRAAYAIHLRNLAAHAPDLALAEELADVITAADTLQDARDSTAPQSNTRTTPRNSPPKFEQA